LEYQILHKKFISQSTQRHEGEKKYLQNTLHSLCLGVLCAIDSLKFVFLFLFYAAIFLFLSFPALAQSPQSAANSGFLELVSQSAVVMDAATGTIVFYKNPDDEIPPASLTKLMTMHLVMKEAALGRALLD
jgi:D-alanyl-D-alanine carboxypeptidase